ncbi:flavodoxin [Bacillus sp. Marseille-Q3570]|uniref:flavodoxin n=1 Tax=Bacillus sp. Marseille-Q3570 TaxID=2963522 RepID=UPI0021B7096F|nr:flavodoxin [Bacillus sp. Marseille-Q3570]
MKRVLILYASMSGNTEEMADLIERGSGSDNIDIVKKQIDIDDISVDELRTYDGLLLGSYTWGDGDLPDEMEDFYDDLEDVDLSGNRAATFGSCDSMYPQYGAAVDILQDKLSELGAEIVLEGLKVELTPEDEDEQACLEFGKRFKEALDK